MSDRPSVPDATASRTRVQGMRALILLNAALLAVFVGLKTSPEANAQSGRRAPGNYLLVGGEITASAANAVYVIDTTNSEVIAVELKNNTKLEGLGYRSLSDDVTEGRRTR